MSAGLCATDLFTLGLALLTPHLPSSRTSSNLRFGVPHPAAAEGGRTRHENPMGSVTAAGGSNAMGAVVIYA
jgi:hypothetical protein